MPLRRTALAALLVALAALTTAPGAGADLVDYREGVTDVDPGSGFTYSVKPVNGTNRWYWYFKNNNASQNMAICYRYSVNGGAYRRPDGGTWTAPSSGGTGTLPAAGASTCDGPVPVGADGHAHQDVSGLLDGTTVQYCAKEWIKFSNIGWQESANPERCQTIRADTAAPTANLQLTAAGGKTDATNNPNGIQIALAYADSVSPPWYRSDAGSFGDNRRCAVTTRDCVTNGSDTFDFAEPCSNGTAALSQTFGCSFNWTLADQRVHQCFAAFEGAVADGLPSNLTDGNAANDSPAFFTQTFAAGTGGLALACDSIVIDRAAPAGSVSPASSTITTGGNIAFTATASDAGSGIAGAISWNFGDGGTATGASVNHTFTTAGTRTVTASFADAAGNAGSATATVTVNAPATAAPTPAPTASPSATPTPAPSSGGTGGTTTPPPAPTQISTQAGGGGTQTVTTAGFGIVAPKRYSIRKGKRALPLAFTVPGAGKVTIALTRGGKRVAKGSVAFTAAGKAGFKLRLPKRMSRRPHTLTITFTPAGGKPVTKRLKIRVVA